VVHGVRADSEAAVVDGLGAVAVGVEEEGTVVALVVGGRGPGSPSLG